MNSDHNDHGDRYIGQRIREYRRVRGFTQQHLADLLGVSRPAVTLYESGQRPVDSRDLLYGLAEALQVSIGDLTGHDEDKVNPAVAAFHAAVPRIEAALMSAGHVTTHSRPRAVRALLAEADRSLQVRSATDYTSLGTMLPDLITELYQGTASTRENDQRTAWLGLARVMFCTSVAARGMGHTSLAWIAAQAAGQAADHTGEAADRAAAAYAQAQVMLATPGAVPASLEHTIRQIDEIESQVNTPADRELYGMLHLHGALTAAALGKDSKSHLNEVSELVKLTGEGNAYHMFFGPRNVNVWRMSVALEQRRGSEVLQMRDTLDPNEIKSPDRKSRYFIELGRGYALEKDYKSSMHALLRAEHIAPQQVRSRTVVRELVGHMLRTARRDLVNGDLGKLAQRVGAVPV